MKKMKHFKEAKSQATRQPKSEGFEGRSLYLNGLAVLIVLALSVNMFLIYNIAGQTNTVGNTVTAVSDALNKVSPGVIKTTTAVSANAGAGLVGEDNTIVGPQLKDDGLTTKIVKWPTISEVKAKPSTGDPVQDGIGMIPTGTPFYVQNEIAGASFDDPLNSQKILGRAEDAIKLDAAQKERFDKLVATFTCDYCCGSPQRVTTINRCGCAHAKAWRGIATFFIKYYGDKYSY